MNSPGFMGRLEEQSAQDMVEHALLAGLVVRVAGALSPGIADSLSVIFSRMNSVVTDVATPLQLAAVSGTTRSSRLTS